MLLTKSLILLISLIVSLHALTTKHKLEHSNNELEIDVNTDLPNYNQSTLASQEVSTKVVPHIRHVETQRFRNKDSEHERYLDGSLLDLNPHRYCQRSAKCKLMNRTSCMGVKLPYSSSTLVLTNLSSEEQVQEKLQLYEYLRYIPKCWAVIQPFLCALYMPKCDNDMVDLPSREMCKITMGHCSILYNTSVFPDFMKCDNEELFPSQCKNDIQELKFNTTGFCLKPLVKTDQPYWYYPGKM